MSDAAADLAALDFPYDAPPAPGTVREVAPGVRWLRMPLPFALDHINLWLVEDGAGWAIVDTGIANDQTKALWEQVFATGMDGRPVTRVFVTHYHPDHMGLAGWLCERRGVELWVTEKEYRVGSGFLHLRPEEMRPKVADYVRLVGMGDQPATTFIGAGNQYAKRVSGLPAHYNRLAEGMTVEIGGRGFQVIIGRGHAPEHACLYCPEANLLIAGDQVLPKISPNISLSPSKLDGDELGQYLASLARLKAAVPADALTLPSHNLPFYGLHTRIDQLAAHHRERLDVVEQACDVPRTAHEVMPVLFRRKLDPHQVGFAMGETLAHLQHAVVTGQLVRTERDGVWLYRRAG